MEYSDFLLMDADVPYMDKRVDFLSYLEWLMADDFAALESRLKDGLEIERLPKRTDEEMIEGIIVTSDKELRKKAGDSNFYVCHALCILYVMKRIFTRDVFSRLKMADSDERTKFLTGGYRDILRWILLDVEDLCVLYACAVRGDESYPSYYRKRHIQTASVHQVLRQGLYGNLSFHSFSDREISATIGTIRQLIELRIRRSFGVMAYTDRGGNVCPLDLSSLFDVLKKYKNSISFPIKLENIIRIYKWANAFIHSGVKDFSWIPYYLEFVLRDFSFGREKGHSWDINNGISTTQRTIDAIHSDLLEKQNERSRNTACARLHRFMSSLRRLFRAGRHADDVNMKYQLLTCDPECEVRAPSGAAR